MKDIICWRLSKCLSTRWDSPSASPPQNRNLTKEMEQILKGYQATTPGYLALEQQFGPQYAALNLALNQQFAPQTEALQLQLEQQGIAGNPVLAAANQQVLAQGVSGQLSPAEQRLITQQTGAGFAQSGNALGNQAIAQDVLNRDQVTQARAQQQLAEAAGVQQLNDIWAGYGQSGSGSQLNAVAQGRNLFDPMPAYASQLQSQNYGGQLTTNLQNANTYAGIYGGLIDMTGSILGGALMASDEKLKEEIVDTGETTPEGIPIKEFKYKGDKRRWRGVVAQDVEKKVPEAVAELPLTGFKMVDLSKIDAPFEEIPTLIPKRKAA